MIFISFYIKVLKLQAAIKYGEEDLQGAKVCTLSNNAYPIFYVLNHVK